MVRQKRLFGPNSPEITLVIQESVLRAPVGDEEIRAEQIRHLRELADRPNITFRVVPDGHGLTGALYFPFTILTPSEDWPTTVYLETLTDGLLVDEAGWVEHYVRVFSELLDASTTPVDTLALLDSLLPQPRLQ